MGGNASGALNSSAFSHSISGGFLPPETHLTHSGTINSTYFSIGHKTTDILDITPGFALTTLHPTQPRAYFCSLFLQSCFDGEPRRVPLNIVVALDVSGSMNSHLSNRPPFRQRLDLARNAIKLLFGKLQAGDVFGMVTFHSKAQTIIGSQLVSQLTKEYVQSKIYSAFQTGGTVIRSGFDEAVKNIMEVTGRYKLDPTKFENRVVLLTDVNDNSLPGERDLIQQISNSHIHTTIIGISTDFVSSTCEQLIQIKGFNYMSAVENQDLQEFLVDQFDYTFFPCVKDVKISLAGGSQINAIKVYGTVDSEVVYDMQPNHTFIVTIMKTGFPSALKLTETKEILMKGGLILIKMQMNNPDVIPEVQLVIDLNYSSMDGVKFERKLNIKHKITAEQYYESEAVRIGVRGYYYTQAMREVLRICRQPGQKQKCMCRLKNLRENCPVGKTEELERIIKIMEGLP